jgi:hypothetical protein
MSWQIHFVLFSFCCNFLGICVPSSHNTLVAFTERTSFELCEILESLEIIFFTHHHIAKTCLYSMSLLSIFFCFCSCCIPYHVHSSPSVGGHWMASIFLLLNCAARPNLSTSADVSSGSVPGSWSLISQRWDQVVFESSQTIHTQTAMCKKSCQQYKYKQYYEKQVTLRGGH